MWHRLVMGKQISLLIGNEWPDPRNRATGAVDTAALAAWMEANVPENTRVAAELVAEVAAAALARGIPSPAGTSTSVGPVGYS